MSILGKGPAIFIPDYKELLEKVIALRTLGKSIVLTSGVYDRWHTGHIKFLEQGKKQGDILIVALDTDELVRKRKGVGRPFDGFEERKEAVASHWAVDIVTIMDISDDPDQLLKMLNPDVFVISMSTGGETQNKISVFETMAGRVENLPPQSSNSTTSKERRHNVEVLAEIKKLHDEFFEEVKIKLSGEAPSKSKDRKDDA